MDQRSPAISLDQPTTQGSPQVPTTLGKVLLLAAITFMLTEVGQWFGEWMGSYREPIFLVAGFGVAALLIDSLERGIAALYIGVSLSYAVAGDSAAMASIGGGAAIVGALAAWWTFLRLLDGDASLPSVRDLAKFLIAAIGSGATAQAITLVVGDSLLNHTPPDFERGLLVWQAAAVGGAVFGPFCLFAFRRQDFRPQSLRGAYELLLYTAVLAWLVYAALTMTLGTWEQAALAVTAFFLTLLVAGRFGLRTTSLFLAVSVFFIPAFAVMFPSSAVSPFAVEPSLGASNAVTLFLLAAVTISMLAGFRDEVLAARTRLDLAMETASLGVWEWTTLGWHWRSPDWCRRFLIDERVTVPWAQLREQIHPDDVDGFRQTFEAMLQEAQPRWFHDCRLRSSQGDWRHTRWHGQLVRRNADDDPAVVAGITHDITEEVEMERARLKAVEKEGELKMLRSQLNPHFLFNTLNSVRALIGREDDQARRMITSMSQLLRDLLSIRGDQMHSLERELGLVKTYLEIEKVRFGERLQYEVSSPPEHSHRRVPGMLIQTLVENSVKHGLSQLELGGRVFVETKLEDDIFHIIVQNDGRLVRDSLIEREGFGLASTRRRVSLATEGAGEFTVEEVPGPAVRAHVKLPEPTTQFIPNEDPAR